jgi:hypothetical protein
MCNARTLSEMTRRERVEARAYYAAESFSIRPFQVGRSRLRRTRCLSMGFECHFSTFALVAADGEPLKQGLYGRWHSIDITPNVVRSKTAAETD